MNVEEQKYHAQIDYERLYWKHKYYESTEGLGVAEVMRDIDIEVSKGEKNA